VLSEQAGIGNVHRHTENESQAHADAAWLANAPENDHKASQSGTPRQAVVGRKFSSSAASRLKPMNHGRTGKRMRDEE
jgi:hypothetical protein